MKLSRITGIAALLAAGTAFAQSSPTIYGVADLAVESVKAEGATAPTVANPNIATRTRLNANSSLLGIKGKVDIGDGTAVIYQFETYIDLGNNQITAENTPIINNGTTISTGGFNGAGSGSVFGSRRDTFLGLTGNWGTLKAGYLSIGFRAATAQFDLAPGSTGVTTSYNVFGKVLGGPSFFTRMPAVSYQTPSMSGFYGRVSYMPNSAKGGSSDTAPVVADVNPSGFDLTVGYTGKAFKMAVVHTSFTDTFLGGYAAESNKSDVVFASYTFPTHTTLVAMYNRYSGTMNKVATPLIENDLDQNSYYLGIKQVVGKHEFMANYVTAKEISGSLQAAANTGATQIAFRYGYELFKNTQAYASYSKITNDDNVAYNFTIGGIGGSTGAKIAKGSDPTSFGFGLRFKF